MGKTLAEVDTQLRELIGDYQRTNFSQSAVTEAINWAQDLVMRRKGFKVDGYLYPISGYPTGALPSTSLDTKRVQLVTPTTLVYAPLPSTGDDDVVIRILDESTMVHEDAANELWRSQRTAYLPRRWTLIGNQKFTIVPPILPVSAPSYAVRVYVVSMATRVVAPTDPIDPAIPNYYQEALRYAAAAYLMEKDTDLKSMQLKGEMMKSFEYHMSGEIPTLAVTEQDS